MQIEFTIELLKKTHLPTIKKLRMEIQLIQMKRFVLSGEIQSKSTRGSCDQPVFDGILNQMVVICGGNYDGETLTDQVERLSWLLSASQSGSIQGFPSHIAATA